MREQRQTLETDVRSERLAKEQAETPSIDIYENDDELLLVGDFPGVTSEQVDIRIEKEVLTLVARAPEHDASATRARVYDRRFSLPPGLETEKVSAALVAGVLSVHLPKAQKLKPRVIPVRKD